jgi:hypothetical protein
MSTDGKEDWGDQNAIKNAPANSHEHDQMKQGQTCRAKTISIPLR